MWFSPQVRGIPWNSTFRRKSEHFVIFLHIMCWAYVFWRVFVEKHVVYTFCKWVNEKQRIRKRRFQQRNLEKKFPRRSDCWMRRVKTTFRHLQVACNLPTSSCHRYIKACHWYTSVKGSICNVVVKIFPFCHKTPTWTQIYSCWGSIHNLINLSNNYAPPTHVNYHNSSWQWTFFLQPNTK